MKAHRNTLAALITLGVAFLAAPMSLAQSPEPPGDEVTAPSQQVDAIAVPAPAQESEPRQQKIEELERRSRELMQMAEQARQVGRLEEADQLRQEADVLGRERTRMVHEAEDRRIAEANDRLAALQRELAEATERQDEEAARSLRFEIREIKGWVDSVRRERDRSNRVQTAEQKIDELLRRAELAEQTGKEEEARALHRQADRRAAELRVMLARDQEKEVAAMTARRQVLVEEAGISKERGDLERANELYAEADEMSRQIERLHREREQQAERMKLERTMQAAVEQAEALEAAGRLEEADRARARAESVARKIEQWERQAEDNRLVEIETELTDLRDRHTAMVQAGHREEARELAHAIADLEAQLAIEHEQREQRRAEALGPRAREKMQAQIDELRVAAEAARQAGRNEEAHELWMRAERLARTSDLPDRSAQARSEPEKTNVQEKLVEEIRALREEIRALRAEVERLRGSRRDREHRPDGVPDEAPI